MDRCFRELHQLHLIDLSLPISAATAEPEPPRIDYIDHRQSAHELATICTRLVQQNQRSSAVTSVITEEAFEGCLGLANETLHLDTHSGTHMDAPWHYGPLCENKPAKTIEQIPLEWCFRPGVVLDLRHKKSGELITADDLRACLKKIKYTLQPLDIVLLLTGADQHYEQPDYFSAHPGMGREATEWLLDQGIKVIGIDSWGFDRPAGVMLQDYLDSGGKAGLLPAHMLGREREYCHIEKMGHLDQIPVPFGFWVACFPIKVERGSAGWVRAVALVPQEVA